MIVNFDERLNNIWCNNKLDSFNKEDPKVILKAWSDLLHKINCINKLEFKNNLLIEV